MGARSRGGTDAAPARAGDLFTRFEMMTLELMDLPLIPLAIVLFPFACLTFLVAFRFLCKRNLL